MRVPVVVSVIDTQGNAVNGAVVKLYQRDGATAVQMYNTATGLWVASGPTNAQGMLVGYEAQVGKYMISASDPAIGTVMWSWDAHSSTPYVTALPALPDNGDEIYLYAGQAGVYWHLRYDSTITGQSKWVFLGGSPLFNVASGSGADFTNVAFADVPGGGAHVVPPVPGTYDVEYGGDIWQPNNILSYVYFGLYTAFADATIQTLYSAVNSEITLWGSERIFCSNEIRIRCRVGNATYSGRTFWTKVKATPVLLGDGSAGSGI